jgi:hypothetical protein
VAPIAGSEQLRRDRVHPDPVRAELPQVGAAWRVRCRPTVSDQSKWRVYFSNVTRTLLVLAAHCRIEPHMDQGGAISTDKSEAARDRARALRVGPHGQYAHPQDPLSKLGARGRSSAVQCARELRLLSTGRYDTSPK